MHDRPEKQTPYDQLMAKRLRSRIREGVIVLVGLALCVGISIERQKRVEHPAPPAPALQSR